MVIKIAVTGEIRSGKDTVCDYIRSKHKGITKLYFAEGIEHIIRKFFPEAYQGNTKPRKHFQDVGQLLRGVNPLVWVNYTARQLKQYQQIGETQFIVTDLRQQNEYEWLKENGFTVIKVEADSEVRAERAKASGDNFNLQDFVHPVELQIKALPYDFLITNNTDLDDLYAQIENVLSEIEEEERGVI